MKKVIFAFFVLVSQIWACKKAFNSNFAGVWNLARETYISGQVETITPSTDSAVQLILFENFNYMSKLGNTLVSAGTFSLSKNSVVLDEPLLVLNNFKQTGIFAQFILYEDNNGIFRQTFEGMYIQVNNDTLTLAGPPTPGPELSYIFYRN
jgi:hypothetical protein